MVSIFSKALVLLCLSCSALYTRLLYLIDKSLIVFNIQEIAMA